MGYFSWKCAVSGHSIPAGGVRGLGDELSHVVFVLPDNKVFVGIYDGYGQVMDDETEELIEIYGTIAPYFFNNPNAIRDDVFNHKKYLTTPDGRHQVTITLFNWQTPIMIEHFSSQGDIVTGILGKTMTQLKLEGWSITSDFYRLQKSGMIKLVRFDHYHGQPFADLKGSEPCPDQGYFYSEEQMQELEQSLNKKERK